MAPPSPESLPVAAVGPVGGETLEGKLFLQPAASLVGVSPAPNPPAPPPFSLPPGISFFLSPVLPPPPPARVVVHHVNIEHPSPEPEPEPFPTAHHFLTPILPGPGPPGHSPKRARAEPPLEGSQFLGPPPPTAQPKLLRPLHPRKFTNSELAVIKPSTKPADEMLRIGRHHDKALRDRVHTTVPGFADNSSIDLGYDVQVTDFEHADPPWGSLFTALQNFEKPEDWSRFAQVVVTVNQPGVQTVLLDAAVYQTVGLLVIKNPLPDYPIFNPLQPNWLPMEDILTQVLERTLRKDKRELFDLRSILFVQIPEGTGTYQAVDLVRQQPGPKPKKTRSRPSRPTAFFRVDSQTNHKTAPQFSIIAGSDLLEPVVGFLMKSTGRFTFKIIKSIDIFMPENNLTLPPGMHIMLNLSPTR